MNRETRKPGRPWPWLALWCALLLPLVLVLPPIPIDETRYLTATWEMFNSGQWLVPTVNGVWYSDKSPLLFWLIAGGWHVVGVHTWVARIEAVIIAVGVLLALRRLAARLGMDARGADAAMWLLAGCLGLVIFSTAIMFDLLLTLTVLGALHGLLDLDAGKSRRGIGWLGAMIGLGVLAKGPVMLLAIGGAALLGPLWSDTARTHKARWYLALLAGLLIGTALFMCWLIPAARYAGPGYWHPLIDKVTGRIANSFAHNRPWWWYLPLLPILWLPWLLTLRAPRAAWAALPGARVGRFALCWWVLPLLAFCAISGKQIHYLLPLLPAWMLTGAWLLQREGARLRGGLFACLALLAGVLIAALPWLVTARFNQSPAHALAGLAVVALIVAAGVWRGWGRDPRALALSATALASTVILALALALRPSFDVGPEAAFVHRLLHARVAVAQIEGDNGLFGYAGRLHRPLPSIAREKILAWARVHPDGILLSHGRRDEPRVVAPFKSWPYFPSSDHRIAAWRAADILAAHGQAIHVQAPPIPRRTGDG